MILQIIVLKFVISTSFLKEMGINYKFTKQASLGTLFVTPSNNKTVNLNKVIKNSMKINLA